MSFRQLPSVDNLLQAGPSEALISTYGRSLTVQALRETMADARERLKAGGEAPTAEALLEVTQTRLENWLTPSLRPVINATGVIVHTNLGRAPLSAAARRSADEVAAGYSTLEYEVGSGSRGSREQHAEGALRLLTGAEAALVVNNNAAAVLLGLSALAQGREVIVSRTQLIEIGGGFRIPDILGQSGARLVEVGTTNRTHLVDFESALTDYTALILRAHHSNFKIVGFTTEPSLEELLALGLKRSVPVLDDLGSGALLDTANYGLGHEPMVQESIELGAPLVAFSGDKLLGGPQAGILVGDGEVIDQLRRHPMARAVRPDKIALAALGATLRHYLRGEAEVEVPVWQMISATEAEIEARARTWRDELGQGELLGGRSTVGGGSLPEETLPTWLLALSVEHPDAFTAALRESELPIIARIESDRVMLDPRTVLPGQGEALIAGLRRAL